MCAYLAGLIASNAICAGFFPPIVALTVVSATCGLMLATYATSSSRLSKYDFKEFAKANKITQETIVFNNMVTTKEELETQWEVTANNSWHKRFLV